MPLSVLRLSLPLAVALSTATGVAAFQGPAPAAGDPLGAAASSYATVGGARVHYKSVGTGTEAIVLVHGWLGDLEVWRDQVGPFSAKHRVIALDLPGHGKSDKPETPYSIGQMAQAVAAVMDAAGVQKATLLGHSMGAIVVREFYRQNPARTSRLVFADGALRLFGPAQEYEKYVALYRGPQWKSVLEKAFENMTMATRAERRGAIREAALSAPHHVVLGVAQAMGEQALYKPDPIKVPVLSVQAKSPFWTPSYEMFLRGLAADIEYVTMEGVSHFLMVDKPKEFNALVLGFLSPGKAGPAKKKLRPARQKPAPRPSPKG